MQCDLLIHGNIITMEPDQKRAGWLAVDEGKIIVVSDKEPEGLEAKHSKPLPNSANADAAADAIIADYVKREGVTLEHQQGDRAFYRPSTDTITLPMME